MTRPITQTGFHRIPRNPKQRNFEEGGTKPKRTVLADFNEQQEVCMLHPTKGWRKLNPKRERAAAMVQHIMRGASANTAGVARFVVHGY